MAFDLILFHYGRGEGQKEEPPDKYSRTYMNGQVKDVVSEYVQFIEVIVKREWEVIYKTCRPELPYLRQIIDVPYGVIIGYGRLVIEMERWVEGVRVGNDSYTSDDDHWKYRNVRLF